MIVKKHKISYANILANVSFVKEKKHNLKINCDELQVTVNFSMKRCISICDESITKLIVYLRIQVYTIF